MAYNLDHADPEEPPGLYADPRAPEEPPRSGRLLRITAALLVMGVFAGGVWFAYHQGLRHGGSADNREIPLVRADTSPFKVKPASPGGMQIPDRDMLIYGEQHPQVEHLLPPPEQPMARPMPPPPHPPEQAMSRPAPAPIPGPPPQQANLHLAPPSPTPLPERTVVEPAPPSPSGLQAPPAQTPSAMVAQPAVPSHAASETHSAPPAATRSQPEPDLIGQKIEQLEAAATASRSKRGETAHAGGLRLQLGVVRSESEARAAWERLKRSNTDFLGNLTGTAVRADLGGKGIYYRIETGPIGNPATASRVCSELRQRHLACMIVR